MSEAPHLPVAADWFSLTWVTARTARRRERTDGDAARVGMAFGSEQVEPDKRAGRVPVHGKNMTRTSCGRSLDLKLATYFGLRFGNCSHPRHCLRMAIRLRAHSALVLQTFVAIRVTARCSG